MVTSYKEISSAYKRRDLSEEAGPLSKGSFGANELAEARGEDDQGLMRFKSNDLGFGVNLNQYDPLGSLLAKACSQRLSKNKSHCGEPKQLSSLEAAVNKERGYTIENLDQEIMLMTGSPRLGFSLMSDSSKSFGKER